MSTSRLAGATAPASTTHTLHIPVPSRWLSANDRIDRRRGTPDRQAWREAGRTYAVQARLPRMLPAVHIIARCHATDARRRDVGNLYPSAKALVDGLVDYGLIPDDDDRHLIGPDMRRGAQVSKRQYPGGGLIVVTIVELADVIEIGQHEVIAA